MKTLVLVLVLQLANGEVEQFALPEAECLYVQIVFAGARLTAGGRLLFEGSEVTGVNCRPPESFLESLTGSDGPCEEEIG